MSRVFSLGLASVAAISIAACSGGDGSSAFGGDGNGNNSGTGDNPNGNPNFNGTLGSPDGGVNAQCAASTNKAELVPVYLVFMIDRSGSMAQNSKWPTIVSGLETFFADPASTGMNASIAFFKSANECDVNSYAAPAVPMTALPSSAFKTTIDTYAPNGGTPTLPAIQGAIQYGQQQAQAHPGSKVAVVLATDGIPNDCNSTVPNVTQAAAQVASTLPTYVIGVGDQLQSLDSIAMGGGTTKAFVVSVGNPQQTATDFETALNVIRGATLSCEFQMPPAPAGKTLDIGSVNVVFTPAGGQGQTLTYNQGCTGGAGWHYDDPHAPTKITLCAGTCGTVQAAKGAEIDVVTGCATLGGVPR
jgi:hypothetical protein